MTPARAATAKATQNSSNARAPQPFSWADAATQQTRPAARIIQAVDRARDHGAEKPVAAVNEATKLTAHIRHSAIKPIDGIRARSGMTAATVAPHAPQLMSAAA